eukprot:2970794-Prymnesium_polylepis.1
MDGCAGDPTFGCTPYAQYRMGQSSRSSYGDVKVAHYGFGCEKKPTFPHWRTSPFDGAGLCTAHRAERSGAML